VGWWRIDPDSGKPLRDSPSKLSRPPDFTLLNAVPGVDDSAEAHYLGDGAWDMVGETVRQVKELLGDDPGLSEDEARRLFLDRVVPPAVAGLGSDVVQDLLQIVEEMWADLDDCYNWDWGRPPRPAERKWLCESAVEGLTKPPGDEE
jgi:hypothetical protein